MRSWSTEETIEVCEVSKTPACAVTTIADEADAGGKASVIDPNFVGAGRKFLGLKNAAVV